MKKKNDYCIYAIMAGKKVFVGKTKSDDYQAILWRHQRGEIKSTRSHFRRDRPIMPRFVPLEHINVDSSWAHRHVIAYIRFFMDEGYKVINSPGMQEQAREIHALTQIVLDEIKQLPREIRLLTVDQDDLEKKQEPEPAVDSEKNLETDARLTKVQEKATEKLNVRLTPINKNRFVQMATEHGATHSQWLGQLMDHYENASGENESRKRIDCLGKVLVEYKEKNHKLKEENKRLLQQIAQMKKYEKEILHKREIEFLKNLSALVYQFTSLLPDAPPLEQGILRMHLKGMLFHEMYQYPQTEETFMFYPEKILLGNIRDRPSAMFIVGHDEIGMRLILRFYPKEKFVGIAFSNEKFGVQGSAWLVRCERAKDGAMNLVFAFPVDLINKNYELPSEAQEPEDDQIEQIEEIDDFVARLRKAYNRSEKYKKLL